jgi:hypothetical protein
LDSLLDSLGVDSDSFQQRKWDEWKRIGPTWQKEITSQCLILSDRLGNQIGQVECGASISEPSFKFFEPVFLSQICHEVWTHFQNLPPEQTRDVGRDQVISQFEKVISSSTDIPEATKEVYLKYLKEPFRPGENKFRKVVGLNPLQGEDDDHKV